MKIGIITQPLRTNYGGLLQNYALQKVLSALGHEVYTINKRHNLEGIYAECCYRVLIFDMKQIIKKFIGRTYNLTSRKHKALRQSCIEFVEKNIKTTEAYSNQQELQDIVRTYNFEGYVVGSDQVWRPCYSDNIYKDFLAFCQDKTDIKRIAYAASFGVNDWEFNDEQTKKCRELAKLFDVISVREDSGIELCKEHLGVEAIHVLDPTLLLEKEDYIKLVTERKEKKSQGNLFYYILDPSEKIEEVIKYLEQKFSFKSYTTKSSPTKWLRAFIDAKIVFTDSFHGCVFSIIFNKPFWVIGNKERGNARFDSLLKIFDLENRRIDVNEINKIDITKSIDWERVNSIKKEWQEKSFKFIKDNL